MLNDEQISREAGFDALLESSGETLAVVDGRKIVGRVSAIVNRNSVAPVDQGLVKFTERDMTQIEFRSCDWTKQEGRTNAGAPISGTTFQDRYGMFHRTETVTRTDFTFRLACESVGAP